MREAIQLNKPIKEESVIQKAEGLPVSAKQRPASKFVYAHYPHSWGYDLDRGFLPMLAKIIAKPGVNGVDKNGGLTMVLAGVNSKGGTYIDPRDKRLGEFMDYVQYYPTQTGGKWYVDFCQTATVLGTGQILWNTTDSVEPWKDFLCHVRDCGILSPMIHGVFVGLVEKERAKIDQLYGRLDRNPHLKSRLEHFQARLEGMEKAWESATAELSKTVAPRKMKRKKAKIEVE